MSSFFKILLIEDDTTVRITIREVLKMSGFECLEASNGIEGFEMLDQSTPDLILCDVNMPVMDGPEFIRALRNHQQFQHIPVILLSADSMDEVAEVVQGTVLKPFKNDELIASVNNCLQQHDRKI